MILFKEPNNNHWRVFVHPLFLLIGQPIAHIVLDLVGKSFYVGVTTVIVMSFVGGLNNVIFYKILRELNTSNIITLEALIMFGLSFSKIIFSTAPETFGFSLLFLSATWLYVLYVKKREGGLKLHDYIVLIMLAAGAFGTVITNYVFFLVPVVYILYIKRESIKKFILNTFAMVIVNVSSFVFLALVQRKIFGFGVPLFWTQFTDKLLGKTSEEFWEKNYMDLSFSVDKFMIWIKQVLAFPLLAGNLGTRDSDIYFTGLGALDGSILIVFLIFFVIWSIRYVRIQSKEHKWNLFWLSMGLAIVGNMCFHFIYGYEEAFIYSQNFLFLMFMFVMIPLNEYIGGIEGKPRMLLYIGGGLFALYEAIHNILKYFEMAELIKQYDNLIYTYQEAIQPSIHFVIGGGLLIFVFMMARATVYKFLPIKRSYYGTYLALFISYAIVGGIVLLRLWSAYR